MNVNETTVSPTGPSTNWTKGNRKESVAELFNDLLQRDITRVYTRVIT